MVGVAQIISICTVRGGSNCKDCIFYGKACSAYKSKHHGKKPMEADYTKNAAMKGWYKNGSFKV